MTEAYECMNCDTLINSGKLCSDCQDEQDERGYEELKEKYREERYDK